MRARLLRGFLPLALTVFLSGACATPPELPRVRVTAPSWSSLDLGRPVRLLPTLDLRPSSLSEDAGQTLQSRYSVFMVVNGFGFIHGARIEGVSYLAGDRLELEVDGARRTPVEVAGHLTSQLLGVQPVTRASGFTPATVDAALALAELPDGLVVLPVLDQLDLARLDSRNSIGGASSAEVSRSRTTVTYKTTSGGFLSDSGTAPFANVRIRLLVAEVVSGQAVRRHWIFGPGAGSTLEQALEEAARRLADGLIRLRVVPVAIAPDPAIEEPNP